MTLYQEHLQLELARNLHHRPANPGRFPDVLALCPWALEQEHAHPALPKEAGDSQEQELKGNYLAPTWHNLFRGLVHRHGVSRREKDLVTDHSSSHSFPEMPRDSCQDSWPEGEHRAACSHVHYLHRRFLMPQRVRTSIFINRHAWELFTISNFPLCILSGRLY